MNDVFYLYYFVKPEVEIPKKRENYILETVKKIIHAYDYESRPLRAFTANELAIQSYFFSFSSYIKIPINLLNNRSFPLRNKINILKLYLVEWTFKLTIPTIGKKTLYPYIRLDRSEPCPQTVGHCRPLAIIIIYDTIIVYGG